MSKTALILICVCASFTAVAAAGLTYTTPAGWKPTPPHSSMRVAEFTLPRAAGDQEDAQLIVYFFGKGGGGSVEDNMTRWESQLEPAKGAPKTGPKRETRKVNGLNVSLVDVSGTYHDSGMMPGASAAPKPAFRMRAGVVETPNGNYFLKLTGPQKTVASWDAAFNQFVASLKYQP